MQNRVFRAVAVLAVMSFVASCSGGLKLPGRGEPAIDPDSLVGDPFYTGGRKSTIWDIFKKSDSDVTIKVNKYIWAASLEVLDFLPIQSVDPFSGIIVTGYGTPPGGGRSYRATVYINDPALDARTLNVAMQTRNGRPVAEGTVRAVEDAILARARQLRIADGKL